MRYLRAIWLLADRDYVGFYVMARAWMPHAISRARSR